MLNTSIVPARNLQKSYKSIIEGVKTKKQAVVLTTNGQPQASLDMLKLATEHKEELKNLPADLRERANEILYSK